MVHTTSCGHSDVTVGGARLVVLSHHLGCFALLSLPSGPVPSGPRSSRQVEPLECEQIEISLHNQAQCGQLVWSRVATIDRFHCSAVTMFMVPGSRTFYIFR